MRVGTRDGVVVFHALHGSSLVLNDEAEALLDLFEEPATAREAADRCEGGDVRAAIELMVRRRLLVEEACDERAEFVQATLPEPPAAGAHLGHLVLLVAEVCNLACPHCIKDRVMDLRPGRAQARMDLATARSALDAFLALAARCGRRDVALSFRAGESLLNAEVVLDASRRLRERWTSGPAEIGLVTNATLVTDEIARDLAALGVVVEVSIDGPRAVHDAIRFTKAGRPTYDAVLAGIARLRAAGVAVSNVNTTVTAETLPRLDARFLAELAALGLRHVNLEPDVLRPAMPDPRELAAWLLALREEGRALGVEVSGCWERAVRAIGEVRRGAELPPPGDVSLLVVDALGQVVRFEYNAEAPLGPAADLPAVLRSAAWERHVLSRSPGRIPECVGCEVEGLCQGNASLALLQERATGRAGLFEHRCELIRAMTRAVLAEPS